MHWALMSFYEQVVKTHNWEPWLQKGASFISYQECLKLKVKPCWHNTFDLETIRKNLRQLIQDMFNTTNSQVFCFKEIRIGEDLNQEKLETTLQLLKELYPKMRIIINIRDSRAISRSGWWTPKDLPKIQAFQELLTSYTKKKERSEWCYVIDYSNVCPNGDKL